MAFLYKLSQQNYSDTSTKFDDDDNDDVGRWRWMMIMLAVMFGDEWKCDQW